MLKLNQSSLCCKRKNLICSFLRQLWEARQFKGRLLMLWNHNLLLCRMFKQSLILKKAILWQLKRETMIMIYSLIIILIADLILSINKVYHQIYTRSARSRFLFLNTKVFQEEGINHLPHQVMGSKIQKSWCFHNPNSKGAAPFQSLMISLLTFRRSRNYHLST